MMTGTSGRACRARGSNSMPLIPGMLTSERMRMSVAVSAEPTRSRASAHALREFHDEARRAQFLAELLAEEFGDVGFVVDDQDQRAHAPAPARGSTIVNCV